MRDLPQTIGPMLAEGRLAAAVDACKAAVRADPSALPPRVALYELSAVVGDWDRCRGQVETIVSLGGDALHWLGHMASIHAASTREACWQGLLRSPVFGPCDAEDQAMFDSLWPAVVALAGGDGGLLEAHAAEYGGMVFGPGRLNGRAFEGLATVDSRLPGLLEVSDGGEYGWLWLGGVSRLEMRGGPANLTEVLWLPARVVLTTGETKDLSVFGLYPGTAGGGDPLEVLGRRTGWDEDHERLALGAGAQLLEIDGEVVPLQKVSALEFVETGPPGESNLAGP